MSNLVEPKTVNPYSGFGDRALATAWQEGYDAGKLDEQCPKAAKLDGRHCDHWQEGDGPCCVCGREYNQEETESA